MNSWLILLLLLLGGQNGCDGPVDCGCGGHGNFGRAGGRDRFGSGDCGCGEERGRNSGDCGCAEERGRNSGDCGCGGERDQNGNDCGCADVNESRFEPRFESGPFGSPGCGCSGQ